MLQEIFDPIEDTTSPVRDICAISILFNVSDEFHAVLSIATHGDEALTVSIFHEKSDGTFECHDLAGDQDGLIGIEIADSESLRIQVRRHAAIVGSAILEVNLALVEVMAALLIPRLLSNIVLSQEKVEVVQ